MYEAYIYRRSDTKQERDRVRFRSRKSSYPQGILHMAYLMARDNKTKAIAIDGVFDGVREPIQTVYWDRDQRFVRYHRTGRYKDNTINRLMSDGTVRFLEYGPRQYRREELPPNGGRGPRSVTYNRITINNKAIVCCPKKKKVVKVIRRRRRGGAQPGLTVSDYNLGYAGAYRPVRTQPAIALPNPSMRDARLKAQAEQEIQRILDKQDRRRAKQAKADLKARMREIAKYEKANRKHRSTAVDDDADVYDGEVTRMGRELRHASANQELPEGYIDADYRIMDDEPKSLKYDNVRQLPPPMDNEVEYT